MKTITNARNVIKQINIPDTINFFDGDYAFLSNFFPSPIIYKSCLFLNVEQAYQGAKWEFGINNDGNKKYLNRIFKTKTPSEAKRVGQTLEIDLVKWSQEKRNIMTKLIDLKFQIPSLALLLENTQDSILIEGNYWNDTYWGQCKGVGMNHLGKILMAKRKKLLAAYE